MNNTVELSTGRFDWVLRGEVPARVPREIIDRFKRIGDLSSTVSDVLDQMGLVGAVGTSELMPTLPNQRIVGTAVTVRNAEQTVSPLVNAMNREWRMAEILAVASAEPGDVLLIEGVRHVSNMGGLLATIAHRQGIAGAVVDGAVRDVDHSRSIGFPVWSRDVSPVTGKWRCVTQEINRPVTLAGVTVMPGDLVIADETGVCFVRQADAEYVVARCEEIAALEAEVVNKIEGGLSIDQFLEDIYGKEMI
jgi:4-hydroxy-4-methyl-2-oxoglutarate aldolase